MDFEQTLLNVKDLKQRLQYASTLPEKLVLEICSKNTELNQTVCLNEDYWKIRYLKNNTVPTTEPKSWKELYLFSDVNIVWSFGNNSNGQLGLRLGTNDTSFPTKIPNLPRTVNQIVTGTNSSFIIDSNDEIWSFGENDHGQLGLGDTTTRSSPTKIPTVEGWDGKAKHITNNGFHTLFIDSNDDVWSFGKNEHGQLGLGDATERLVPTQIPNIKAKQIACGENHSLILDINDNVWSFGKNISGQLGL